MIARNLSRTIAQTVSRPITGRDNWTPRKLFLDGTEGVWYDINPQYAYQDSAGTTAASVGDPVGYLTDRSGNGHHATQPTAASRPILRQDAYRAEFDGTDDYLTTGRGRIGNMGLFADATEQWFVAGCYRSSAGGGTILARAGGTSSSRTLQILADVGGFGVVARGDVQVGLVSGVLDGEYHVFLLNWDGAALTYMHDGLTPSELTAGAAAEETSENILIGARTTSAPTVLFGGDLIPSVMGDRSLTSTEQQKLMRYLAKRVGKSL